MQKVEVKIKLVDGGKMPVFKTDGAVCADCFANQDSYIPVGGQSKVRLGFAMELPKGWEAVIRPRSGLSKDRIHACIGSIDTDYRGEVNVSIENRGSDAVMIKKGERCCQIAIREVPEVMFVEVKELTDTERGSKGFGSTGKN